MRVKDPDRFARRMQTAGLTQSELARELRVSKAYISTVARGIQRINEVDAAIIARLFRSRASMLFEPANEPPAARAKIQAELMATLDGERA